MKTILCLILLCSSTLAVAANKPPTVIVVPNTQAPQHSLAVATPNTSVAVIAQRIDDLAQAEARRETADNMLLQTMAADITMVREKQTADDVRLDKLEAEAVTIYTVGGLALTLLLAFFGWSATVANDRHKENRETNHAITQALQHLSTSVAVIESKLGIKNDPQC